MATTIEKSYIAPSGEEITWGRVDVTRQIEVASWKNPGTDEEECRWSKLFDSEKHSDAVEEYERWKS